MDKTPFGMTARPFSLRGSLVPATMTGFTACLLAAICLVSGTLARKGFGPGEQEWGYVQVRPNANMFWWLYYTSANVSSYYDKPLIIWLQGGPGASSTSYGNFEELGPLDLDLKPRNYTWVKDYNVLFIDNPVGTGFSYTTSSTAYATTNAQIASDLVECMRGFLKKLPKFANVSTYITTESYGGKMGAEFALAWYKAQQAGTIKSKLKGVALGDAWISPIDSVLTWGPFLYQTGMVDKNGLSEIDRAARATQDAVRTGKWRAATNLWSYTEGVIVKVTHNINFYNILTKTNYMYGKNWFLSNPMLKRDDGVSVYDASLTNLMNGPVKRALNLSVNHGVQSNTVFSKLQEDFMKPVVDKVELLLNQTDLKVIVLTGQLDLIVDTPGTFDWVDKMQWKGRREWRLTDRVPLTAQNVIEGYATSYGNLAMYWVNRAGHMVPKDNPAAMAQILKRFTG
ncbi:retinoid-inducible serine carboxypeptidase [Nomia melanderi]|uniref:retinoid-inducible serine carboxypeptidase n=1 Tax=Nomia melanderi TaxID=2448451 RepID=UPI0013045964|nr:retinoid-inducible serine carboxypeptidase-like isoform X1 [Nomia melanderi]